MKRLPGSNSPRILLIRFSSLGDVVLASALIRALRQTFPDAEIDFVVRRKYAELVRHNPRLNTVFEYDARTGFSGLKMLKAKLRGREYGVVLDLQKNFRSVFLRTGLRSRSKILKVKKNQFLRFLLVKFKWNLYRRFYARPLSVAQKYLNAAEPLLGRCDAPETEIFLPPAILNEEKERWNRLREQNFAVVMAPGARHFTKRWPADYYVRLIRRIYENSGGKTVLVGGKDEASLAREICAGLPAGSCLNLCGELSVLQTAALISLAPFFISNDSGLMHVAAAFGKPQIAIFGSTTRELGFFPQNPRAVVMENNALACRPCSHIGRAACPKGHFKCMREITPEMVYREYISLMNPAHF